MGCMGEDRKIDSFESFLKDVLNVDKTKLDPSDKSKEFAVLFGNGLSEVFFEHHKREKLFLKEYMPKKILDAFNSKISEYLKLKDEDRYLHSPGAFAEIFNLRFAEFIVDIYVNEIRDKRTKEDELRNFIELFNSIFTINLDVVLYHNIFDEQSNTDFVDGFWEVRNKDFSEMSSIENCFKKNTTKIPLLYLHGAFHIVKNIYNNRYTKIIRNTEALPNEILNRFAIQLDETDYYLAKNPEIPHVCLTSNWVRKHALISNDPYFRFAFDKLKNVENLFIFGCSFKNDHHILIKLAESEELKNLYIGFNSDETDTKLKTKDNVELALKELVEFDYELTDKVAKLKNKIIWVETSDFSDVIWDGTKQI